MPDPRPDVLDFLLTRRTRPVKLLVAPAPDHAALKPMLQAAARVPDHGKLEPWRFIVLEGAALKRLADLVQVLGQNRDLAPERVEKTRHQFAEATLVVAVVCSPVVSEKVPQGEQILSAGGVCLSLLNAALASGWGANWLTGWMATDREFLSEGLDLDTKEFIAGFIHIGTQTSATPDRPRPDLDAITSWVSR